MDRAVKTKRIRLDRLVRAPGVVALAERAIRGTQTVNDALRSEMSDLVNSLGGEGGRAAITTYFMMDPDGRIALGSNPEWDGLQIVDPRERDLPDVGILEVRDAETGEVMLLDTSLARVRDAYRQHWEKNQRDQEQLFRAHHLDHVLINAAEPYDLPMVRFFEARARKL